ncbi:MAG: radical SAM protein [Acutalibacter sp.]|nr:radical SAM protein [Acutalibacter sp.]
MEGSLKECRFCPRNCGANREIGLGACRSGNEIRIARAALHFWEEPPISGTKGSGTVFFTGCPLGCIYCQNREISQSSLPPGKTLSPKELSALFFGLAEQGAHNINLVTPTHFMPLIREALLMKKLPVPVVYNTSGYETVGALRELEGLVDIYLPDFKYADSDLSRVFSHAPDYPGICVSAIEEMVRQVGSPVYDEDGMMKRGVLIRHLILPGHTANSLAVLEEIARRFSGIPVSLMAQYTPPENFPEMEAFPELQRPITKREQQKVEDKLFSLGIDGFVQSRSARGERYLPDFHQFG